MNLYITEIPFGRQSHDCMFGMQNFVISTVGLCLFKHDMPQMKHIQLGHDLIHSRNNTVLWKRGSALPQGISLQLQKKQLQNLNTAFFFFLISASTTQLILQLAKSSFRLSVHDGFAIVASLFVKTNFGRNSANRLSGRQ